MKAKLVTISLMTRVVVPETATEEQILNQAKGKFIDKIETELSEHVEEIVDDEEMPYGTGLDEFETLFKEHVMVNVAECYLTDEVNEGKDLSPRATVLRQPTDNEELVMIEFLSGEIDYVPQDILEVVPKETPLIEQECIVEVEYTDMNGVKRTASILHNGDEDCWDGVILEDEDIAFDFNTFGGLSFGDTEDAFNLNAYQCTVKRDGVWTMDEAKEIECKILKIIPRNLDK
jgi:hypothetical protein